MEAIGPPGDPQAAPRTWLSDFQKNIDDVETYADYREMLKKADIDAADVYASIFAHHPIAEIMTLQKSSFCLSNQNDQKPWSVQ